MCSKAQSLRMPKRSKRIKYDLFEFILSLEYKLVLIHSIIDFSKLYEKAMG